MDVLTYLLCYSLEVKDKPRKAQFGARSFLLIASPFGIPRTAWFMQISILHHSDALC